ncbi:hypothetical protein BC938DRAFT_477407 [Jimgerdemannia flammicorona]|uniref:Uncharacterized protein n=1 Tax=Jimgerdemannia flammicorona TaxID=994334 RepID=A0A433QYV2_9FUNG|nr:hypothetical protein BC938DRAFT_477407 [Jimgerdemannia flammicorona]
MAYGHIWDVCDVLSFELQENRTGKHTLTQLNNGSQESQEAEGGGLQETEAKGRQEEGRRRQLHGHLVQIQR